MSLHLKTTLLASAIILIVILAAFFLLGWRILERVNQEQRELSQFQAVSLAEHLNNLPTPRDYNQIAESVKLLQQLQQSESNEVIRVWERSGGNFEVRISSNESNLSTEIPEELKLALRSGQTLNIVEASPADSDSSLYQVFVPIFENERISGAVEIVERLDTFYSLVWRYAATEIWLALGAIVLMSLALYLLFRSFVYAPIDKLLAAMKLARSGKLQTRVTVKSNDEIGKLSQQFNEMLSQIDSMNGKLENQNEVLAEKVLEATSELMAKNDLLAEANREIWRSSRKMNSMERMASAGQTAAQFAHEVGTPLNLISGHVQLLRSKVENQAEASRLDTIATQIERIEKIVRGMLDRTRPEKIAYQMLDLNSLLRKTCEATSPTLEEKNVILELDLKENLALTSGNADRLQQVFINLINNALDAMPNGGKLVVSTDESEDKCQIKFTDDGCGMDAETKSRIFEPLYTTKSSERGTGLGLVVVRQILAEHQAEISVSSESGKGSCFKIVFNSAKSRIL